MQQTYDLNRIGAYLVVVHDMTAHIALSISKL